MATTAKTRDATARSPRRGIEPTTAASAALTSTVAAALSSENSPSSKSSSCTERSTPSTFTLPSFVGVRTPLNPGPKPAYPVLGSILAGDASPAGDVSSGEDRIRVISSDVSRSAQPADLRGVRKSAPPRAGTAVPSSASPPSDSSSFGTSCSGVKSMPSDTNAESVSNAGKATKGKATLTRAGEKVWIAPDSGAKT